MTRSRFSAHSASSSASLVGKLPVDRPDANAGAAGDVLHPDVEPVRGDRLGGGREHLLAVAPRVGAEGFGGGDLGGFGGLRRRFVGLHRFAIGLRRRFVGLGNRMFEWG